MSIAFSAKVARKLCLSKNLSEFNNLSVISECASKIGDPTATRDPLFARYKPIAGQAPADVPQKETELGERYFIIFSALLNSDSFMPR